MVEKKCLVPIPLVLVEGCVGGGEEGEVPLHIVRVHPLSTL